MNICVSTLSALLTTEANYIPQTYVKYFKLALFYNLQFRHLADALNPERLTMARYVGKI